MWLRLTEFAWSRTFWAAPMLLPLVVISVLLSLRPREVNLRAILQTTIMAAPAGFLLWVLAWKELGGGTGSISPVVGITAAGGWIALNGSLWLSVIERRPAGWFAYSLTAMLMLAVHSKYQTGATPILLSLVTSFTAPMMVAALVMTLRTGSIMLHNFATSLADNWRVLKTPADQLIGVPRPLESRTSRLERFDTTTSHAT